MVRTRSARASMSITVTALTQVSFACHSRPNDRQVLHAAGHLLFYLYSTARWRMLHPRCMFSSQKELMVLLAVVVMAGAIIGFGPMYAVNHWIAHRRITYSSSR